MGDSITTLLFVVEQVQPSRQYFGLFQKFINNNIKITVFNFQPGPAFKAQVEPVIDHYYALMEEQSYWNSIVQLKRLTKKIKPDIVHCQEFISSFYFGFVPKNKGMRSIYHRRHNYTSGFVSLIMDQWAVMRADRTVAVCKEMEIVAKAEHPFFAKKIISKTNAITLGIIYEETLEREKGIINQLPMGFSLMLLSRLRKGKGHEIALRVVKELKNRGNTIQLLFVGEGAEEAFIRSQVKKLDLINDVYFLGNFENIEIAIEKADALLVPSEIEAFPKTPLEGMAYGSPVIAHSVGGIVESITHGVNGFLVKKNDVDAFVRHIEQLMKDSDLKRSIINEGKKTVKEKYVDEIMAKEFMDLYQELKYGSRKS